MQVWALGSLHWGLRIHSVTPKPRILTSPMCRLWFWFVLDGVGSSEGPQPYTPWSSGGMCGVWGFVLSHTLSVCTLAPRKHM